MARLHTLRIFTGDGGMGGNPLGVFLDGTGVPASDRGRVAARLGFSETVFVDRAARGELRIFTPATELPFAGHPLVGAAWLLAREGYEIHALRPPAGVVPARVEGDVAHISGRPEWCPPFEHVELGSPAEVDGLTGPPGGHELAGAWAWENRDAGEVRVRVFPVRLGVPEDEATGSYAVRLAAHLGRALSIRQGEGSRIVARPGEDGMVEVGGNVTLDEMREEST